MATKPDESDPEWVHWFRRKMDEGGPEEDAFYERMRLQGETISRAATRAKLQADTVGSYSMVDQDEACALLGLDANSSAVLIDLEANTLIMRFGRKGYAAYPLFQFDAANLRVYPALIELLKMSTDDWGRGMALLDWLDRPNRSLGGARPRDRLGEDAGAIINSFEAEISQSL